MTTKERVIPATIAEDGSAHYTSVTSAPDDSTAVCYMVPRRVIPVIFVPGVMGTNLKAIRGPNKDKPVWLVNSGGGVAMSWIGRGAETRKQRLDPDNTDVYDGGDIPSGTAKDKSELIRRGWGTVAKMSYGTFLPWLENALNDAHECEAGPRKTLTKEIVANAPGVNVLSQDEVGLSYMYQTPVYAVGYNWLQSNVESAKHLATKIKNIIDYHNSQNTKCEKVILVTHSMGGLVARHYSEVDDHSSDVLGIVHGVMPTTGSATAYKRVTAGTEGVTGSALGPDSATMTAVFAQSPGPLQLLPSIEYGMGWLQIVDGSVVTSLPKADPYGEVYLKRGKWWSLVNDQLINPMDNEKATIDTDWNNYVIIMQNDVKSFHTAISGKFHQSTYAFYGNDNTSDTRAWGDVVWKKQLPNEGLFKNKIPQMSNVMDRLPLKNSGTGTQTFDNVVNGYHTREDFVLQDAADNGDGTVPVRSGSALEGKRGVKACVAYPRVAHEGAFKERPQQLFALWAVTRIIGNVKGTSLEYKK